MEKDASYGTVKSLGEAASSVLDIECGEGTGSSASAGWDQDTCGDKATIGVFADSSTQREVKAKNPTSASSVIVEGPNWIVWAKQGNETRVQDKLGGKIVATPRLFTANVSLRLKASSVRDLVRLMPGNAKECFASPDSLYKDISANGKAVITTSSGVEKSGSIVSSKLDGLVCTMSYEIVGIPADDGPYAIKVGYRNGPEQSEADLKSGAELSIGS